MEGGVVYAGSLDGNIYALDLNSGQPVWEEPFAAEKPIRAAPILLEGILVVADRSGNLYGLDPATGDRRWSAPSGPRNVEGDVLGHPILLADRVLVSTRDGDLFQVDPEDGRPQQVRVRSS